MAPPTLELDGLTCGYGDIIAVERLSLAVESGEVFALIGANGAGKTTTIMAIAGLVAPRAGSIRVAGADLTGAPAHARVEHGVALVPEGRRVFADLTVDENLTVGGTRLERAALEESRARVFELFPRLAERRRQLAGSLSGGEQQMLAIGRALMARPALMLIDELSLGLMPRAVDECYAALRRLREEGLAILLVEQSTERALATADHVGVLASGRLTWSGTGAEARTSTALLETYLGLDTGET